MKRFHLHIGVESLSQSVAFYSTLFGQPPSKLKSDYAKWMLDDPRINFAISTRVKTQGVDHLGIQVDSEQELSELTERLKSANLGVVEEGKTSCCYAHSEKAWVQDPSGVAWETYRTMADAEIFAAATTRQSSPAECCSSEEQSAESCCG